MPDKPRTTQEIIELTYDEWMAEGKRLFGEDFFAWKFVCPICRNVASVGDYQAFKDQGATPDSATNECIGRYNGSKFKAFSDGKSGSPCNYALYGLFKFPGMVVTLADGKKLNSFAFAGVSNAG